MVYDPLRDRVLMFGGYNGAQRADLWALNLATMTWEELQASGEWPAARHLHSAVYVPGADGMLLFGGSVQSGTPNDTWFLRLAPQLEWIRYPASPRDPGPTVAHSTAYDAMRRRMLIFGGFPNALWEFRLYETTAVNETQRALARSLQCSPTPARSEAQLRIDLARRASVQVDVLDLAGRRVKTLEKGDVPPGEVQVLLTGLDQLSAGLYLVRARADVQSWSGKLLIIR
jgi:hypothetical protein